MGKGAGRATPWFGVLAFMAIAAAAGCRDSGLPGRNTPVAEAEQMAGSYPLYEAGVAHTVRVGDHDWMVAGPPMRIPENLLVAVGRDGEREVFALATDPEPHSRLYRLEPAGWVPLAQVGGPPAH